MALDIVFILIINFQIQRKNIIFAMFFFTFRKLGKI